MTPTGPAQARILRLELIGFLADVDSKILVVGDVHQVDFELPVLHFPVSQSTKIIKTYDRTREGKVERLVEFHFEKIGDDTKNNIIAFLRSIRQTDSDP